MASGDVVNTAARLQSAAPVNGDTRRRDDVSRHPPGDRVRRGAARRGEGQGRADPRVGGGRCSIALRRRRRTRGARRRSSDASGSSTSCATPSIAHASARTPQLLTLVGVPGIGKSRLVYELRLIVEADPELITWRQGRCLAYGDGVTLWALGEIVKAQAGIHEQDPPVEAAAKVRRAVEDASSTTKPTLAGSSRISSRSSGLASESELGGDRRDEAFSAWRRFFEAMAEQRPLVLVVEDLHWADESLLDFVDELVDWVTDVPLLVVATARPELLERRPGWGGGKLNATTLALAPLSDEQTALLLGRLLDRPVLDADRNRRCSNAQAATPSTPSSSQSSSSSRLGGGAVPARNPPGNHLGAPRRAATRGKGAAAGRLGRRQGLLGRRAAPRARRGGSSPAFARAQGVRAPAAPLVGRGRERVRIRSRARPRRRLRTDRARRPCREAPPYGGVDRVARSPRGPRRDARLPLELGARARRGRRCRNGRARRTRARCVARGGRSRVRVERLRYRSGALCECACAFRQSDGDRPELLFSLARALFVAGDERAENALEEARDALVECGDRETAAESEAFLAQMVWFRGQQDEVFPHLHAAEELIEGAEASPGVTRVLAWSARYEFLAGDKGTGLRRAEEGFAMAERLGLDDLRVHALTTIGSAKEFLGDPTGRRDLERAIEIGRTANSPMVSGALNNLAVVLDTTDARHVEQLQRESLHEAERFGDANLMRFMRGNLIPMWWILGEWNEALAAADGFIAECEQGSPHILEGPSREFRGYIKLARGHRDEGLGDFTRALELARKTPDDPQFMVPALVRNAWANLRVGRVSDARSAFAEAIPHLRRNPFARPWTLPEVALELGETAATREILAGLPPSPGYKAMVAVLDGDFEEASELYAGAGILLFEAEARLRAAEQLLTAGRRAEGEVELEKALTFYRSVGANLFIERGEQLLAKSA